MLTASQVRWSDLEKVRTVMLETVTLTYMYFALPGSTD